MNDLVKPMNDLGAQLVLVLLLCLAFPLSSLAATTLPAAGSLPALSTPQDSLLGREAWSAWIEEQQALGALEEDEAGQLWKLYSNQMSNQLPSNLIMRNFLSCWVANFPKIWTKSPLLERTFPAYCI